VRGGAGRVGGREGVGIGGNFVTAPPGRVDLHGQRRRHPTTSEKGRAEKDLGAGGEGAGGVQGK
jgi:hypothetical protein